LKEVSAQACLFSILGTLPRGANGGHPTGEKYRFSMQPSDGEKAEIAWRHSRYGAIFAGFAVVLCSLILVACRNADAADVISVDDGQMVAMHDLPARDAARFAIGAAIFAAPWIAAPNVSDGADGLGPLYTGSACAQCHPGGTHLPQPGQEAPIRHVVRFDGGDEAGGGDPRYGRQLQDHAIVGFEPEGRSELHWLRSSVTLGDGSTVSLRAPDVSVSGLSSGPLGARTRIVLLRPPPLAGLGLVAAIDEDDIAAGADPDDRDGDGICGRVGRALDPASGEIRLARFGWKASAVSLGAQTAGAFNLDMGLSSPLSPDPAGDCTLEQRACRSAPDGRSTAKGGHEVSAEELSLLVAYLEGLAPTKPAASAATPAGQGRFMALGCGTCHREAFTTPEMDRAPHLSHKPVRLFSDLLVHDMGAGLAASANAPTLYDRSWRTAPLWGLGQRLGEMAAGQIDGLLHDGRARTIEEAILWHGGEGQGAREAYRALAASERAELLAYLAGL